MPRRQSLKRGNSEVKAVQRTARLGSTLMTVPHNERLSARCLYSQDALRRPSLTTGNCCTGALVGPEVLGLLLSPGWIIGIGYEVDGCALLWGTPLLGCLVSEASSALLLKSLRWEVAATGNEDV